MNVRLLMVPLALAAVFASPLAAQEAVAYTEESFNPSRLQEQTATYQFLVEGNATGTATDRLVRDGDAWVLTRSLETPQMSQHSEVRFGAADFTPIMLEQEISQGAMTIRTSLRAEDGRITGHAELPEQMGGPRDIDVELVPGVLLTGMATQVLATADLAAGRTLTLPVFNMMSNSIEPITYEVQGVEEITVPAGTFNAFRVQSSGTQQVTLYLQQDAPHLWLRQEFANQPIVIELVSVE